MSAWAISGAPASAPKPCTTLNTPSGRPASWAMSASRDAVSGAHSDGLSTTVLPAANAGAIFQVASISGAFHGVMIGDDAGRVVAHVIAVPAGLAVGMVEPLEEVGEEPEVVGDPGHHAAPVRAEQGAVVAGLDDGQVVGAGVDAVGDRVQDRGALGRRQWRPRPGKRFGRPPRRRRPRPRRRRRSRAIGCSSMGEMSVNVSAEATRSPPIQCRVSTVTPSTVAPISWVPAIANPISPSSPDSAIVRAQTY